MYQRTTCKALHHQEVQDLVEAELFAEQRGKKLNTGITIHPKLLYEQPDDVGRWVSWLTNKIRIFCERDRGFGYFAIWVRENYDGDAREHLHLLIYVPNRHRSELEEALRRWLPGDPRAVKLTEPEYDRKRRDRLGRSINKALTYLLKQMSPQARYALQARGLDVRRERHCRKTGAPVAAVLGKRCGISRSLNAKARRALWPQPKHPRPQPPALPNAAEARAIAGAR